MKNNENWKGISDTVQYQKFLFECKSWSRIRMPIYCKETDKVIR